MNNLRRAAHSSQAEEKCSNDLMAQGPWQTVRLTDPWTNPGHIMGFMGTTAFAWQSMHHASNACDRPLKGPLELPFSSSCSFTNSTHAAGRLMFCFFMSCKNVRSVAAWQQEAQCLLKHTTRHMTLDSRFLAKTLLVSDS